MPWVACVADERRRSKQGRFYQDGPFRLAAGRLLHTAQTLTVVANGPLTDDRGASIVHCSMTARPTAGLSLVSWPSGAHAAPSVTPVWVAHPLDVGPPSAHVLP
jgi:hypothetical protein